MPHDKKSNWIPGLWDWFILGGIIFMGLLMEWPPFKKQAPWLVSMELAVHSWLTTIPWSASQPQWVSVVEVDDQTFWSPPFGGSLPTNRRMLARLITGAVKAGARVIALDFQFKSPTSQTGDDPVRYADDAALLEALEGAEKAGIPVVVTCGLVPSDDGWQREPDVCDDSAVRPLFYATGCVLAAAPVPPQDAPLAAACQRAGLSPSPATPPPSPELECLHNTPSAAGGHPGPALGYINLPEDKRQIPLSIVADEAGNPADFYSFALQTASAFVWTIPAKPGSPTHDEEQAQRNYGDALKALDDAFVYAGFMPRKAFEGHRLSGLDLLCFTEQAPDEQKMSTARSTLAGQIVFIGGTFRQWGKGRGPYADRYASPVGMLDGVYLHANYVEDLLGHRIARPLKQPLVATLPLLAALAVLVLVIVVIHWLRGKWDQLGLWLMAVALLTLVVIRAWPLLAEVFVSYLLIVSMHRWRRLRQRLGIWLVGIVILSLMGLAGTYWAVYFDFLPVALLLGLHVAAEHYENLREYAKQGGYGS